MEENNLQKVDTKNELMTLLKTGTAVKIVNSPVVANRFITLYEKIHGKNDGQRFYESNKFHFLKILSENPKIASCTNQSIYGVFLDASVNGLSFDPTMKHLYIIPYSFNTAPKNQPAKWEQRATLQVGGPGELLLRVRAGQIKYADNPVLVYEGEPFKVITAGSKTVVHHEMVLPRKSDVVIGCYMAITRVDGSVDYKVMSTVEVLKLRLWGKDKDENSKTWGPLGLPGMIAAKTIKHAFKTYPKVRTGDFSKMLSDTVDIETESVTTDSIPENIDYGFIDTQEEEKPVAKKTLKETVKKKEKQPDPDPIEAEEFDEEEAEETLSDSGKNTDGVKFDDEEDF